MKFFTVLITLALFAKGTQGFCANGCGNGGNCVKNKIAHTNVVGEAANLLLADVSGVVSGGLLINEKTTDVCLCPTEIREDGRVALLYRDGSCQKRYCPFGKAWGAKPYANGQAHPELECSGKGSCDTSTGNCKCDKGFTGSKCHIQACENNCSGRGECKNIEEFVSKVKSYATLASSTHNSWTYARSDKTMYHSCLCDAGYHGKSCQFKTCPSNSDPNGGPGAAEGLACSGRGSCQKNGSCKCGEGYKGDACEITIQSTSA